MWCRSQLQLRSDPRPGSSMCWGGQKKQRRLEQRTPPAVAVARGQAARACCCLALPCGSGAWIPAALEAVGASGQWDRSRPLWVCLWSRLAPSTCFRGLSSSLLMQSAGTWPPTRGSVAPGAGRPGPSAPHSGSRVSGPCGCSLLSPPWPELLRETSGWWPGLPGFFPDHWARNARAC